MFNLEQQPKEKVGKVIVVKKDVVVLGQDCCVRQRGRRMRFREVPGFQARCGVIQQTQPRTWQFEVNEVALSKPRECCPSAVRVSVAEVPWLQFLRCLRCLRPWLCRRLCSFSSGERGLGGLKLAKSIKEHCKLSPVALCEDPWAQALCHWLCRRNTQVPGESRK